MKLVMFSPKERDLERGWPGRLDGDRVVQFAAQTLQAFFTGGGSAREHDTFPVDEIVFRAPVLHPGSVRLYDGDDFVFGNPACIYGPGEDVPMPEGAEQVESQLRLAVVIGAGVIGGFTLVNDWLAPELAGSKAHDFALSLGPVVVTPDEFDGSGIDWLALLDHAELNTRFYPGDIVAAPVAQRTGPYRAGDTVELALDGVGTLRNRVVAPA